MIIVAIIALSAVVLTAVYAVLVGLPSLSAGALATVTTVLDYIASGVQFFYYFVDYRFVRGMITIFLTFEGVILAYKFVMWVAKKIPMFGVSD